MGRFVLRFKTHNALVTHVIRFSRQPDETPKVSGAANCPVSGPPEYVTACRDCRSIQWRASCSPESHERPHDRRPRRPSARDRGPLPRRRRTELAQLRSLEGIPRGGGSRPGARGRSRTSVGPRSVYARSDRSPAGRSENEGPASVRSRALRPHRVGRDPHSPRDCDGRGGDLEPEPHPAAHLGLVPPFPGGLGLRPRARALRQPGLCLRLVALAGDRGGDLDPAQVGGSVDAFAASTMALPFTSACAAAASCSDLPPT